MADTDPILRPAIEAAIAAERADPDLPDEGYSTDLIVTGYVLVVELKGFNTEGEDVSQTCIFPEGSVTTQLGLLSEAQIRYQAEVLEKYR